MEIFTVGHGAGPAAALVEVLRREGIRVLVDVRTAPGSRRHPQYGKDALAASLAEAGIAYEWEKELGGCRTARPDSPHAAIRNPSFRGYADHMETGAFRHGLERLIRRAASGPTAVMCAETVWWKCHRRMIADALVTRGIDVFHLAPGRAPERHRLNPAVRITDSRLVYDVTDPGQLPL
jgi:uncharacterized protein (DUF488 family)